MNAGCDPPPLGAAPAELTRQQVIDQVAALTPAVMRVHQSLRLPLQVDCVHECEATRALERLRKLADHWDTEAACTDTHGAYMRSMAVEVREILDGVAGGMAVAGRAGPVSLPGRGPGGSAGGGPGAEPDPNPDAPRAGKAKGGAGKNKRPAKHRNTGRAR